jgi:hypothetical protein
VKWKIEKRDFCFFVGKVFWESQFWTFFLSIFEKGKYFMPKTAILLHN